MGYLHTGAASRRLPQGTDRAATLAFHRHELARHRDILRAAPRWYLLPFLPAAVVFVLTAWVTQAIRALVLVLVSAGTAQLVHRPNQIVGLRLDRQRLDRQLTDVTALEGGR